MLDVRINGNIPNFKPSYKITKNWVDNKEGCVGKKNSRLPFAYYYVGTSKQIEENKFPMLRFYYTNTIIATTKDGYFSVESKNVI